MLELLHIENIAIIERADILFGRGFNALTGETGAGKSIVIDALGAVLGQRTSRELIRTGAEKAFVSATFSAVTADLPGLAENGFTPEEDGTLLLQRELYGDGKNVCRMGGRSSSVSARACSISTASTTDSSYLTKSSTLSTSTALAAWKMSWQRTVRAMT